MICEKYRNLKIIYDDHTCLEKETVLSTMKNLNKYFDRINVDPKNVKLLMSYVECK